MILDWHIAILLVGCIIFIYARNLVYSTNLLVLKVINEVNFWNNS